MNYDELTTQLRERLALSSQDEADAVTRSVLVALAARLTKEEGSNLARSSPMKSRDHHRRIDAHPRQLTPR